MATQPDVLAWLQHNIHTILEIHGTEAAGVLVQVDADGPFIEDRDGNFSQRWKAAFQHGANAANRREAGEDLRFLGHAATGRPVIVRGVATGNDLPTDVWDPAQAGKVAVLWDRLPALAQIGVRAVGRPIIGPERERKHAHEAQRDGTNAFLDLLPPAARKRDPAVTATVSEKERAQALEAAAAVREDWAKRTAAEQTLPRDPDERRHHLRRLFRRE